MKSTYYPPRSRLPSVALNAWFEFRRAMRLEKLQTPYAISPLRVLLSFLVPGFSFVATGRSHLGWIITSAWATSAIVFVVFLGHTAANIIFGLMIGAHAISILWLLRLWVDSPPLWLKLAMAGASVAFLGGFLYWPSLQYAEENWFMPLNTRAGITVVQRRAAPEGVRVGDVIAFRIDHKRIDGIYIRDGFDVGMVLAAPGAKVEFLPDRFLIDGQPYTKKPHMPGKGSLVVPQNHWFLWPDIDIQLNGVATEATATDTLMSIATVPQYDYIGRPYRRWFGRFQKVQ